MHNPSSVLREGLGYKVLRQHRCAGGTGAAAARSASAKLAARSGPLVEMGHVPELGLGAVVRGVAGRVERGGTELPTFVHRIELEIERRLAVRAQQSWLRELHHALQGLETRVGGLHPPAHEFNRQEAAAYLDVRFARS